MAASRKKRKRSGATQPADQPTPDQAPAPAPTPALEPAPPQAGQPVIMVNSRKVIATIFWFCISAELLFLILDATINYAEMTDYGMIRRMFNIAREDGLASWFGTTQTWCIALTLWLVFIVVKRDRRSKGVVIGWMVLAIFFTYMSADDGAEIHERMGSAFKKRHTTYAETAAVDTLEERLLDAFPSYTWQIVFMPIFGAMGIFMIFFLWKELANNRARFKVFLALFILTMGVVFDWVEGLDEDHPLNTYTWIASNFDMEEYTERVFDENPYDTLRHFSKAIEECIEMMANTILWSVFLGYLAYHARELRFRVSPPYKTLTDS